MPRSSFCWKTANALWITTAGWAAAAERRFGKAYTLTMDRIVSPSEVLQYPLEGKGSTKADFSSSKFKYILPVVIKIFLKDILLCKSSKLKDDFKYPLPARAGKVSFIWKQHDFFPGIRYSLA